MSAKIENMEKQFDIIKKLGASHVGESSDIIQNCDYAFIQSMTKTKKERGPGLPPIESGRMFFKKVAARGAHTSIDNFIYNFIQDNGMKLEEDADSAQCNGYTSLKSEIEENTKGGVVKQAPGSRYASNVITNKDVLCYFK